MTDFESSVDELARLLERAAVALAAWPAEAVDAAPRPGAWTPRDVLIHLIDSASNNHARFVRAGLGGPLRFEGYAQDDWVALQRSVPAPWDELVALWRLLNLHVLRVMRAVPADVRARAQADHGLHEVAWENPPADTPMSLEFFMRDYAAHLAHHLRQIDEGLADEPGRQLDDGWLRSR